jgi:hypothetical protein
MRRDEISEINESHAFDKGFAAARAKVQKRNPYPAKHPLHGEWNAGYLAGAKKNPAPPASRADSLFRAFHKRAPRPGEVATMALRGAPVAIEIGKIAAILYSAKGKKKKFLHRFKEANAPRLFVSADGRALFALGGNPKFSARGFLG